MPGDRDTLQGAWKVVSCAVDGRKMPPDALDGSSMVIKGSRFTSSGMGAPYEGTVELDETKTPKAFDLHITDGHAAGTRNLGIHTVDGVTWTICLATRGTRRPKTFTTGAGTGFALETPSVVAGPQTMLKARFTFDRSAKPQAIDYVNLEGSNRGKLQAGICELKGGTLSICMAAPGKPRPGEFASTSRDGRSYTTWRRTKACFRISAPQCLCVSQK